MDHPTSRKRPRLFPILVCLAIALFGLAYPNWVIQPQRRQDADALHAALFVLRYRGIAELLCSAAAVGMLWLSIRFEPRRRPRIATVIAAIAVVACAALSRVNIYELMFHPAAAPSFQPVREVRLDGAEKVLAIEMGQEARAYPIRGISYHHIVNDVMGGVPIAVTY
jgi:hypothetical protein